MKVDLLCCWAKQYTYFSLLPVSTSVSQRYGIKDTSTLGTSKPARETLFFWVPVFIWHFSSHPCAWHHNSQFFHVHFSILVPKTNTQGAASFRILLKGILSKQWMTPFAGTNPFYSQTLKWLKCSSLHVVEVLTSCVIAYLGYPPATDIQSLCRPL